MTTLMFVGCAPTPPQRVAIPPNPQDACVISIVNDLQFAPLSSKIQLGGPVPSFDILTIQDRPTAEEKALIEKWVSARQTCFAESAPWRSQWLHPALRGIPETVHSSFLILVAELYNGSLTYGDFAKKRAELSAEARRQQTAIVQQLNAQAEASRQQEMNRAQAYLLNQSLTAPRQTTCSVIGSRMVCQTY